MTVKELGYVVSYDRGGGEKVSHEGRENLYWRRQIFPARPGKEGKNGGKEATTEKEKVATG